MHVGEGRYMWQWLGSPVNGMSWLALSTWHSLDSTGIYVVKLNLCVIVGESFWLVGGTPVCPLWLAPFPGQGSWMVYNGERDLCTNMHALVHHTLFLLDCGYDVISFFSFSLPFGPSWLWLYGRLLQVPNALASLQWWTLTGIVNQISPLPHKLLLVRVD